MTALSGPLIVDGVDVFSAWATAGMANVRGAGGTTTGKRLYVGAATLQETLDLQAQGVYVYPTLFGTTGAIAALAGRANAGDVIFVLPGHTESITGSTNLSTTAASATGYSIVGLGSGAQRPNITWTAAASALLMNVAGVELANLQLNLCSTAATVVVTPITVSAAGCRIVNCFINWGLSTTIGCGSTLGAIAVTSTRFDFIGNECVNLDTAGTAGNAITLLSLNGAGYCRIIANRIFGATTATTVGPIHFLTTLSANTTIMWNYIENLIAGSTKAISSAIAGVTGTIAYNQLRVNSGIVGCTASANISCSLFQNYTNNTANKNGALDVGSGTSA